MCLAMMVSQRPVGEVMSPGRWHAICPGQKCTRNGRGDSPIPTMAMGSRPSPPPLELSVPGSCVAACEAATAPSASASPLGLGRESIEPILSCHEPEGYLTDSMPQCNAMSSTAMIQSGPYGPYGPYIHIVPSHHGPSARPAPARVPLHRCSRRVLAAKGHQHVPNCLERMSHSHHQHSQLP